MAAEGALWDTQPHELLFLYFPQLLHSSRPLRPLCSSPNAPQLEQAKEAAREGRGRMEILIGTTVVA